MEVEDFNQKEEEGEMRIRVEDLELCLIGKSFTQAIVRLIRSKR